MKVILVLLLVGFAVAKPAFDFEEEFIHDILRDDKGPSASPGPSAGPSMGPGPSASPGPSKGPAPTGGPAPSGGPTPDPKDVPLFFKFAHFLFRVSVGNVKPDEHPDLKYKQPGEELVKSLLDVRKAVIAALKPIHDIAKLMIQDHIEMMKKVKEAVDNDNIFQAKHVVGEYFIALNRRFLTFFVHAEQSGLFEKIGEDKDDEDMKKVRRAISEAADKAKSEKGRQIAEFILKNFNQFRVSDGLPDGPFVRLGVETSIVLAKTFKQMEKATKISMKVYIDMVSDIVRLALKENNRQGAIQRAGAGVLSMVRRQTKVGIVLHRIYNEKKCFAPGSRPVKEFGGKEEKEDKEEKEEKEEKDGDDEEFEEDVLTM